MTTHHIPADEEIAAKGDEAHVRCCGRRVRYLPDGDDMVDPAWPGTEVTCPGASTIRPVVERIEQADREEQTVQDAAELADAKRRVQAGLVEVGKLVTEALTVRKINPMSLEMAEMRCRLDILSNAAFGDGSLDQHGYELAVQQTFVERLKVMMGQADQIREARASEARRVALLDGVNGFRPPGGGRP